MMKAQAKKFQIISILLFIFINFSLFNVTNVYAADTKPTLWIKIHRIEMVDEIEGWLQGGPDWYYQINVWDGKSYETYTLPNIIEDGIVDYTHSFSLDNYPLDDIIAFTLPIDFLWVGPDSTTTVFQIVLYESDPGADEVADISSSSSRVIFWACYDFKTNSLFGDTTYFEEGYYKTSGDYDGSTSIDENDANLWFDIWDNYNAPKAVAGVNVFCYVDEKVNFDGSGSSASTGSSISKYEWDFESDGRIDAEGARTSFTFTKKGRYTVTLRVTDSIGVTDSETLIVTVGNKTPIPSFTLSPREPTIRDTIHFYDTSEDPDGTIVSWYWNFGDGHTSTIKDPTHDYSDKGSYTVTLRVTDDDGDSDSTTKILTFINLAPVADFTYSPSSAKAGTDIQFTDKSTDPEGKSLEYLWDFGDGDTSTKKNPVHKYEDGGEYSVKLIVTDDADDKKDKIKIVKILQTHDLTVKVKDILGIKITNAEIELYTDGESYASGKTDTNGELTLTEIVEGEYDINVKVIGQTVTTTRTLSKPTTVQVQVTVSTNTIGITGGIIVVVAIIAYLAKRRKTGLPAEDTTQEATLEEKAVTVVEDDSLKEKKNELERERITEILQSFKDSFDKGEIDEETYHKLKLKYESELENLE